MRYALGTALVAVFFFAFGTAGAAWAKGCGGGTRHHGNPSVQQYVEKIPTACGSKGDRGPAAGGGGSSAGSSGNSGSTLPPAVSVKLNKTARGKLLRTVASSGRFGAPPIPERKTYQLPQSQSALGAGVSAVSSGSSSGLIALLVVMAAVTLGVVGVAAYRRRPTR
jgi:hypothetical protein